MTTEDQAARIAALMARRSAGGDHATPSSAPPPAAALAYHRPSHPAARSRSFTLGAAVAGTAILASSMWSAAPAAPAASGSSVVPGATVATQPAPAPAEQIVIRIVHRPSPAAAAVRQAAPSVETVTAPPAATPAPAAAATPAPVTRSRGSG